MKTLSQYKKRFYLLICGSLIFILFCYKLAFKQTLIEIAIAKENMIKLGTIKDAPIQLELLDKRYYEIGGAFRSGQNGNNYEVLLLEKANALIKRSTLKITDLPKTEYFRKGGFVINTQQIVIQGSFVELLDFLYSIERDSTIGNISSVDFSRQKIGKSDLYKVKMKIYFQSIIQDQLP